jgi:hypothetical protein
MALNHSRGTRYHIHKHYFYRFRILATTATFLPQNPVLYNNQLQKFAALWTAFHYRKACLSFTFASLQNAPLPASPAKTGARRFTRTSNRMARLLNAAGGTGRQGRLLSKDILVLFKFL